MIRFAMSCTLLAGAIWFSAFYKLGDKTLVGHLEEIYDSPVVQKKVAQMKGHTVTVSVEKRKDTPKPKPVAAVQEPAPVHPSPAVIDARPNTGEKQKGPAHDNLTQDDREGLNKLLQQKLH